MQKDVNPRNVKVWALLKSVFLVGTLDALFKAYALAHFPEEQDVLLHPVLSFAIHKNLGVAFDLPIPHAIVIPLTIIIIVFFLNQSKKDWPRYPLRVVASVAVVIGALGNLVDRLINGFTTDYLIFFRLSAINLSDVLIVLGILGLLWYDRSNPQHGTQVATD